MADTAVDVHMVENEDMAEASHLSKISKSSILDLFEKLGFPEENARVESGVRLLFYLNRIQKPEDVGSCREVSYTLKRLIRGVSSTFVDKKAGHFAVLVELLSIFPYIKVQDVMDIVNEELQPHRSCTKKEITEVYGGHVFVIGALIRSKKIFSAPSSLQAKIVEKLITASMKKDIFIPCVCSFLVEYIDQIDDKDFFKTAVWMKVEPLVTKSWEMQSADILYLILKARQKFSKVIRHCYNIPALQEKQFIHENSIPHIIRLLMDPYLIMYNHPFYELMTCEVATSPLLFDFWNAIVKEVEKKPSIPKEISLILMCGRLVDLVDKKEIPQFLCASFMNLLGKSFHNKHYKIEMGKDVDVLLGKMVTALNEVDDDNVRCKLKVSFIKCFIHYPGNLMYPQKTGSVIRSMCFSKEEKGMKKIGKMLRQIICNEKPKVKNEEGETCPWSNAEIISAVDVFAGFVNLPTSLENLEWKIQQVIFLISEGFFYSRGSRSPPNMVVAGKVRQWVFKIVDPKFFGVDQLITLLLSVVHHINNSFADTNLSKLFSPLSESSQAAWEKMFSVVNKLQPQKENEPVNKESEKKLFVVLFLYMGLQLLKDATLAEEVLQELHCCYERTKMKSVSKKKHSGNKVKEPHWVEVIVDLFLSLLSQNSHCLRNLVVAVFPYLCPYLNSTSMHQILQVLDPHSKQSLFCEDSEGEDSNESGDEMSEENKSHNSVKNNLEEVENGVANGDVCNDGGDDDDDEEEEDEDDDDDDDDDFDAEDDLCEPVDAKVKLAVQNALKNAGGDERGSDEDSEDMDKMSKAERIKLDSALSEAFKLLKPNKGNKNKKMTKDDEMLMHFRVRILDVVEVFLSNNPDLSLVLDTMQSLFDLLEFCIKDPHQKPLEVRVKTTLSKLAELKSFSNFSGVNIDILAEKLKKLLQKGERTAVVYQNISNPLSKCCTFLARTSLLVSQCGEADSSTNTILKVYREALISFFTHRDSLIPLEVFKSVLLLTWEGSWSLAGDIFNYIFASNCRPFRRSQALKLLIGIMNNRRHLNSTENIEKLRNLGRSLIEKSEQLLVQSTPGNSAVSESNLKEFVHLLHKVFETDKLCEKQGFSSLDWTKVKKNILLFWQQSHRSTSKKAVGKLARALQINLQEVGKECKQGLKKNKEKRTVSNIETDLNQDQVSVESSEGDKGYVSDNPDNTEENRKRKRSKASDQKGKAFLKKKSKAARLETMSTGLDSELRFSQVDALCGEDMSEDEAGDRKTKFNRHKQTIQKYANKTSPPPQHLKKFYPKMKQGKSREFRVKKQKVSE